MQKVTEQKPHLRAISLDYDGFYSHGFSRKAHSFACNRDLMLWLKEEDHHDPALMQIFLNGSLRQDCHLDVINSERNNVEYCFRSLPILVKNFVAVTGMPAILDPFLTVDLRHHQPPGTCFAQALAHYDTFPIHQNELLSENPFFIEPAPLSNPDRKSRLESLLKILGKQPRAYEDKTKISMLLVQLHKIARKYATHRITFIFGDDINSILDEIKAFFTRYPFLIPPNVENFVLVDWNDYPNANKASRKPNIRHRLRPVPASVIDECYFINYLKLCSLFLNEKGILDFSQWQTMRLNPMHKHDESAVLLMDHFLSTRDVTLVSALENHPSNQLTSEWVVVDKQCLQLNGMLRLLDEFVSIIHPLHPREFLLTQIAELTSINVIKEAEHVKALFTSAREYLKNYNAGMANRLLCSIGLWSPAPTPANIMTLLQKFEAMETERFHQNCDPRLTSSHSPSIPTAPSGVAGITPSAALSPGNS